MPVYCGEVRSHAVKASSGKRSKKAHQRSRCRKVSGKAQADANCSWNKKRCVVRSSAVKRFNPYKYATQRGGGDDNEEEVMMGGASDCKGKSRENCVAPCQYRSGAKRSFCTAVGKRVSKKALAVAERIAELPAYERAVCLKLSEEMCGMDPNCQWVAGYERKNGKAVEGRCGAKKGVRKGAMAYEGPLGRM